MQSSALPTGKRSYAKNVKLSLGDRREEIQRTVTRTYAVLWRQAIIDQL